MLKHRNRYVEVCRTLLLVLCLFEISPNHFFKIGSGVLLQSIFSFLRPHPRLGEINEYSSSMEVHGQLGADDQLGDFWHGVLTLEKLL